MCILFIYVNPNPKLGEFRIIIASNRDEFYQRPSEAASNKNDVIGGRDLFEGRQGGMWLGISTNPKNPYIKFKFAALLNVTGEDRRSGRKGRGFIVENYLTCEKTANVYANELIESSEPYNAYNFVAMETEASSNESSITHCSNVTGQISNFSKSGETAKRVFGFGNTVPQYPAKKVIEGEKRFEDIVRMFNNVEEKETILKELVQFLKWDKSHLPCPELEKRQPIFHKYLSCVYVKALEVSYGTRTHTIVLIDFDWNIEFFESTMKEPIDADNPEWINNTINAKL